MAVMEFEPSHPVAEALDAISAAQDGAADAPCWSLSDDQVDALLQEAHRVEARLQEVKLRLVAEADRRKAVQRVGATSMRIWLRRELRLSPHEVKHHLTLAAALAGRLDLTRQALAAGELSRAHVAVVVKVMDTLPSGVGDAVLVKAERELVSLCRRFAPDEVAGLGRRLWEVIDPDGADAHEAKLLERQEREAKRRRQLSFGSDGFGMYRLSGLFDAEAAALIAAALDPLAKPMPSTADGPDPRTPGQRYCDAMVELCAVNSTPATCRPEAVSSRS